MGHLYQMGRGWVGWKGLILCCNSLWLAMFGELWAVCKLGLVAMDNLLHNHTSLFIPSSWEEKWKPRTPHRPQVEVITYQNGFGIVLLQELSLGWRLSSWYCNTKQRHAIVSAATECNPCILARNYSCWFTKDTKRYSWLMCVSWHHMFCSYIVPAPTCMCAHNRRHVHGATRAHGRVIPTQTATKTSHPHTHAHWHTHINTQTYIQEHILRWRHTYTYWHTHRNAQTKVETHIHILTQTQEHINKHADIHTLMRPATLIHTGTLMLTLLFEELDPFLVQTSFKFLLITKCVTEYLSSLRSCLVWAWRITAVNYRGIIMTVLEQI